MNKWIRLLLLLLSASLALNLYLLSTTATQNLSNRTENIEYENQQNLSSEPLLSWTMTDPSATQSTLIANNRSDISQQDHAEKNRDELLAQATLWLKDRNFLTLSAFLQGYLKQ